MAGKSINHISIIISTRNAVKYIDRCIQSALSQDYSDFEIIFIDAQSTDGTFEVAKKYEDGTKPIKVFQNEKRKFQGENLRVGTEMSLKKSICISLDGDDWLKHENVLARVNAEYVKTDCLMTYGTYEEYPYRDVRFHYHAYPTEVVEHKTFRQHAWLASHLRTWRRELFLKINIDDMKDELTGDYVSFAPDLSFQFPMLEMAGSRSRYIPDILYVYNRENENNEAKQNQPEIDRIEKQLRARPPYSTLEKLYDDE